MWREVFGYAVNPEVYLDAGNLRQLIGRAGLDDIADKAAGASPDIGDLLVTLTSGAEATRAAMDGVIGSGRPKDLREIERLILAQTAPFARALGAWLQGLSAPGVFEDDTHLKSLALLADDIGVGRPEASRADAYRLICRRIGLTEQPGSPRDLASARGVRDCMYRLPAVLFALSRRSDAFGPEIAGVDLALRSVGLLPAWRVLATAPAEPEWARLDLSVAQSDVLPAGHTPLSLSRLIAERYCADPANVDRVRAGIGWVARGLKTFGADLTRFVSGFVDPRLAMAQLVQERAREAAAYHERYKLEGESLADWFKRARTDPLPLVDALARSKLVRPRAPERSLLINTLIRPDGPMFRIFRREDVALIRRWIESLVPEEAVPEKASTQRFDPPAPVAGTIKQGDLTLGPEPRSLREAYYLLQGRALAPRTRAFARDYARFWLDLSRRSIDATERSLPPAWQPGRLRTWLLAAHEKADDDFKEHRSDDVPSREDVIEQTVQLAPLTLIDGAWLQGFTEVAFASTAIGYPLFEIYWDELGNGDWKINHPKLYREVLAAMDVTLPPTGSREFAWDARLNEVSFRLPVYWLCLGKFPLTLRPEILGMNLAMELSGVGGSYRAARRFLQHYGFPTVFVDIHNTIDNVSTGHSAWAADAIDAYMLAASEFADLDQEWERVRAGYESLAPIVRRPSELAYFRNRPPGAAPEPAALGHALLPAEREAQHA